MNAVYWTMVLVGCLYQLLPSAGGSCATAALPRSAREGTQVSHDPASVGLHRDGADPELGLRRRSRSLPERPISRESRAVGFVPGTTSAPSYGRAGLPQAMEVCGAVVVARLLAAVAAVTAATAERATSIRLCFWLIAQSFAARMGFGGGSFQGQPLAARAGVPTISGSGRSDGRQSD